MKGREQGLTCPPWMVLGITKALSEDLKYHADIVWKDWALLYGCC